jgi:hypothetical protein
VHEVEAEEGAVHEVEAEERECMRWGVLKAPHRGHYCG